jgi:hypothetical protein
LLAFAVLLDHLGYVDGTLVMGGYAVHDRHVGI